MTLTNRLDAMVSMRDSMPHVREIELNTIIEREYRLTDALGVFCRKLLLASGHKNITLNILHDFLWSILVTLWDGEYLTRARELFELYPNGRSTGAAVAAEGQMKNALEMIKSLKAEVLRLKKAAGSRSNLETSRSDEVSAHSLTEDEMRNLGLLVDSNHEDPKTFVKTTDVMIVPAELVDEKEGSNVPLTEPDPLTDQLHTLTKENEFLKSELVRFQLKSSTLFQTSHSSPLILESVSHKPFSIQQYITDDVARKVLTLGLGTTTRVELVTNRSTATLSAMFPDRDIASSPTSPEHLVVNELLLMRQRESEDELRINELLKELIEKDEVIKTLTGELDRVNGHNFAQTEISQHNISTGRIVTSSGVGNTSLPNPLTTVSMMDSSSHPKSTIITSDISMHPQHHASSQGGSVSHTQIRIPASEGAFHPQQTTAHMDASINIPVGRPQINASFNSASPIFNTSTSEIISSDRQGVDYVPNQVNGETGTSVVSVGNEIGTSPNTEKRTSGTSSSVVGQAKDSHGVVSDAHRHGSAGTATFSQQIDQVARATGDATRATGDEERGLTVAHGNVDISPDCYQVPPSTTYLPHVSLIHPTITVPDHVSSGIGLGHIIPSSLTTGAVVSVASPRSNPLSLTHTARSEVDVIVTHEEGINSIVIQQDEAVDGEDNEIKHFASPHMVHESVETDEIIEMMSDAGSDATQFNLAHGMIVMRPRGTGQPRMSTTNTSIPSSVPSSQAIAPNTTSSTSLLDMSRADPNPARPHPMSIASAAAATTSATSHLTSSSPHSMGLISSQISQPSPVSVPTHRADVGVMQSAPIIEDYVFGTPDSFATPFGDETVTPVPEIHIQSTQSVSPANAVGNIISVAATRPTITRPVIPHSVASTVVQDRIDEISVLRTEMARLQSILAAVEKERKEIHDKYHNLCVTRSELDCVFDSVVISGVNGGVLDKKRFFEKSTQTISQPVSSRRIFSPTSLSPDVESLLNSEREKTKKAMEETQMARSCLNELERQLATLQQLLRNSGVKDEHLASAMATSGLTKLLQSSRVGVFERLYRDAVDRMIKMNRIRQMVHEIESKELERKLLGVNSNPSLGSGAEQPTPFLHHERLLTNPSRDFGHKYVGGGYQANWNGSLFLYFNRGRYHSAEPTINRSFALPSLMTLPVLKHHRN